MAIKIRPLVYLEEREDPPGPSLPPYTLRLRFKDGVTPTFSKGTGVLVSPMLNIWDLTYENSNWEDLLESQSDLLEVIGGGDTSNVVDMRYMFYNCTSLTSVQLFNTSNVTNMKYMFRNCGSITSVSLFDTSNVEDMQNMFEGCTQLTSVPLFDTSNVTRMDYMFWKCGSLTSVPLFDTSNVIDMTNMCRDCTNVQSGALALYQQASTQTNPPHHGATFRNCGSNTQTGSAELAQIPVGWK